MIIEFSVKINLFVDLFKKNFFFNLPTDWLAVETLTQNKATPPPKNNPKIFQILVNS